MLSRGSGLARRHARPVVAAVALVDSLALPIIGHGGLSGVYLCSHPATASLTSAGISSGLNSVIFDTDSAALGLMMSSMAKPVVGIIMGSTSDWETMQHAAAMLEQLGVPYEKKVVSAHRTPKLMVTYAGNAAKRGLKVIIAGAGGAAHLPGMTASMTTLPVLGVPVQSAALKGMDSLLSIVQMPGGVPVATFAIGKAGATNAALFAAQIISQGDKRVKKAVDAHRETQTATVLKLRLPSV